MTLYQKIVNKESSISVIGLGYVGMPVAIAFAEKINVIGFDLNKDKINLYNQGIDPTNEVGDDAIKQSSVYFTSNEEDLQKASFHIIAVPTPVNQDNTPDLLPIISACQIVGRNLQEKSIVVFESTVYPGTTEDICVPILEKESGLKCGEGFKVGYSPERINPGDKVHRLQNIVKIVSGMDKESLEDIAAIYSIVIEAGVFKASSIKVAESAKVVENSQRDINIAFMNELAVIFDKMGIDSHEVIEAMNTKWNSLGFKPGLVGGHCIGVDPYYLIYKAQSLGYHSQIMAAGRKVNDSMGEFVVDAIIKKLVLSNKRVKSARVGILGITFKENCPDIRNSKVENIIKKLQEFGIEPMVVDPWAPAEEVVKEYRINLYKMEDLSNMDCLVFAVSHDVFKGMKLHDLDKYYGSYAQCEKVLIDVKGIFNLEDLKAMGYSYWRL